MAILSPIKNLLPFFQNGPLIDKSALGMQFTFSGSGKPAYVKQLDEENRILYVTFSDNGLLASEVNIESYDRIVCVREPSEREREDFIYSNDLSSSVNVLCLELMEAYRYGADTILSPLPLFRLQTLIVV